MHVAKPCLPSGMQDLAQGGLLHDMSVPCSPDGGADTPNSFTCQLNCSQHGATWLWYLVLWGVQVDEQELERCMGLLGALLPPALQPPGLHSAICIPEAAAEGGGCQLCVQLLPTLANCLHSACSQRSCRLLRLGGMPLQWLMKGSSWLGPQSTAALDLLTRKACRLDTPATSLHTR